MGNIYYAFSDGCVISGFRSVQVFVLAEGTPDLQTKDNYRYVHSSEVPLHMPIALTTASSDIQGVVTTLGVNDRLT